MLGFDGFEDDESILKWQKVSDYMKSRYDIEVYRVENKFYSTLRVFGSTLGYFLLFAGLSVGLTLLLAPVAAVGGAAGAAVEGVKLAANVARGA